MLFAQTRWDRKETRALFCMHVEYEVPVGVCVCSATQCCFVNLQNGSTPGCVNTRYAMMLCDDVLSTYKITACTHAGPSCSYNNITL